MSRYNRSLLAAWLPVLLLATIAVVIASRRSPDNRNLNHSNYEKIAKGMTEREVYAILGGPPGNYVGRRIVPIWGPPRPRNGLLRTWEGQPYIIYVWFDAGQVSDRAIAFSTGIEESLLDRLRRWLGL